MSGVHITLSRQQVSFVNGYLPVGSYQKYVTAHPSSLIRSFDQTIGELKTAGSGFLHRSPDIIEIEIMAVTPIRINGIGFISFKVSD